jgi:predicted NUDIX family NTP pyrophosphohydrolase
LPKLAIFHSRRRRGSIDDALIEHAPLPFWQDGEAVLWTLDREGTGTDEQDRGADQRQARSLTISRQTEQKTALYTLPFRLPSAL